MPLVVGGRRFRGFFVGSQGPSHDVVPLEPAAEVDEAAAVGAEGEVLRVRGDGHAARRALPGRHHLGHGQSFFDFGFFGEGFESPFDAGFGSDFDSGFDSDFDSDFASVFASDPDFASESFFPEA
jgi:hypothetical protein